MTNTPQKQLANASLRTSLTPVRVLDSPKSKAFAASYDANVVAIKTRLSDMIKNVQANHNKWIMAHQRGLALCQAVDMIKTRALETQQKYDDNKSKATFHPTLYPSELQVRCDKLALIENIFTDIANATKQIQRQLQALINLSRGGDGQSEVAGICFFRTWQLPQFLKFVKHLQRAYVAETEIKETVIREIAHSCCKACLIRHTTAWEYPLYAGANLELAFKFLAKELEGCKI